MSDDLAALLDTPQVTTDEHGTHRDRTGVIHTALDVDGEVVFVPQDLLDAAALVDTTGIVWFRRPGGRYGLYPSTAPGDVTFVELLLQFGPLHPEPGRGVPATAEATLPARVPVDQWAACAATHFRTDLGRTPNPGPDAIAVAILRGFIRDDGGPVEQAAVVRAVLAAHAEATR